MIFFKAAGCLDEKKKKKYQVKFVNTLFQVIIALKCIAALPIIRDLKIPRFRVRVRVRVGLPVPVLGYTGNQSNLRYTGWHQVRSAQKCKGYIVFRMPSEHRLKLAEKYFSIRFNCLFFFLQYTTNMSSTQKWKKPRLLLSKSFSQEVSFQVNIKYLIWI